MPLTLIPWWGQTGFPFMAEDPQIWDEGSREQEQPLTPFTYPRLPGTEAQRGQLSPGTYREDTAVWSSSRQPGDLTSLPEVTLDTCMQECKSFSLLFGVFPPKLLYSVLNTEFLPTVVSQNEVSSCPDCFFRDSWRREAPGKLTGHIQLDKHIGMWLIVIFP